MKCLALATFLLAFGINTACAQSVKVGEIEIDHAWAAATGKGTNSAAYMTLVNTGTKPDELVSAASPLAHEVILHVFDVNNGIYGMRAVNAIEVMPGAAATILRPGSAHIMLEGLKQPMKTGERFPLSLTFKKAGNVKIEVTVKGSPEATAQAMH
jgi:hypothetical protein